jgi:hypothetical protein
MEAPLERQRDLVISMFVSSFPLAHPGANAADPSLGPASGPRAAVASCQRPSLPVLDLTDFKRDLSELTDRLGHAQDCL